MLQPVESMLIGDLCARYRRDLTQHESLHKEQRLFCTSLEANLSTMHPPNSDITGGELKSGEIWLLMLMHERVLHIL